MAIELTITGVYPDGLSAIPLCNSISVSGYSDDSKNIGGIFPNASISFYKVGNGFIIKSFDTTIFNISDISELSTINGSSLSSLSVTDFDELIVELRDILISAA